MKELCRITLLFCMALLCGLTSCSQYDDVAAGYPHTGVPIEFEVEVQDLYTTRGSILAPSDFTEYGLFGVYGRQVFANNLLYTKDEDGNWVTNSPLYWPAGAANFYAVNMSFKKKPDGPFDKASVTSSKQTFTYTVPENTDEQVDVMIASAFNCTEDQYDGKVKLRFIHAMAFLNFTIVSGMDSEYSIDVGGISVYNLFNSGTFTFNKTAESNGSWVTGTTRGKMERVFDEPFRIPETVDFLVDQDSLFMLVPQAKTTKWKTTKTNNIPTSVADANGHTYLKLLCKIQNSAGNYIFGSADEYGDVYLPFNIAKTSMAKTTTYRITFAGGYDADGVPLSFGSDFSIELEDWENETADPIDVEF